MADLQGTPDRAESRGWGGTIVSLVVLGLIAAIVIAALAIGWGVARHRRAGPLLIAGLGLATMTVALIVGHGMEEAVLTIIGVAMVSIGHWMNLRGTS